MRYKVRMEWIVDVPDGAVEQLKKVYPGAVDPKQLAAFMAMDKAFGSLTEKGHPDAVIDVEEVVN